MTSNNTNESETFLIHIDFSRTKHLALDRAFIASRSKKVKPKLHLCVGNNRNTTEYYNHAHLEKIIQSIEKEGLEYNLEHCDSKLSYESVLDCAERINPNITMIADYDEEISVSKGRHPGWGLPKEPLCPVMILRPGASSYSEHGFMFERNSVSSITD
jgi:hypothetical protein